MAYSKQEILEKLIEFKKNNDRYPNRKDFDTKNGLPGRNTVYRAFGSIENAIKQAELFEKGELIIEDDRERKSIQPISRKYRYQCAFCGNWIKDIVKYHSSLGRILTMKFTSLLSSNEGESYFEGVLDCLIKAFRPKNPIVEDELKRAGYWEMYEARVERSSQNTKNNNYE